MESILCTVALMLSLFPPPHPSGAKDVPDSVTSRPSVFRTDRLSRRQVKIWNSIRKLAFAPDSHGRPLHPTLHGLWRSVESSGHPVFVELITDKEKCSNIAGESVVEKLDPAGRRHTIRLRLFVPTIDRAYAEEQAPLEGIRFIPFSGLKRERRYAKVLGHELAHIAKMLRDPDYLRILQEICLEQRAIAAATRGDGERLSDVALEERWNRMWPLVLESEKPALAAEAEIYRELLSSKR